MRHAVAAPLLVATLLLAEPPGQAQEQYADPPIAEKDRAHWAFVSPKRPDVPRITDPSFAVRNPVDVFVLSRLKTRGLSPSPEADRVSLIRRVTLDLTGLPPTPGEIAAFLKDRSEQAYEKVVDRLLASPHFGERWAQHWLDVVRFAESNGYELDAERVHAWRYRDYVIRSFNKDKPYDRFVTEQLAGDLLAKGKNAREAAELWIATGIHRCGPVHVVSGNLDPAELRQERLTEMVNGIGSAFLGLTVGCARCHDHKFDPFSAGDYFRLQAFFAAAEYADVDFATPAEVESRKKEIDALNARMAPIKQQVAAIDAPYRAAITKQKRENLEPAYRAALDTPAAKRSAEQKKLAADSAALIKVTWDEIIAALSPADRDRRAELRARLHELEAQLPHPAPAAWAVRDGKPAETFVLKRGDPGRKLISVGPGLPRVVNAGAGPPQSRLDLAKWMMDPDNPLTARVIVNRLWHHHFGRGLVATPNDFGTRGEKPSHPELLDWLARELVEPQLEAGRGRPWSLKHIHRLIVTSSTYRQSTATEHGREVDPANVLLWRMNRRRLEAEAVRDSILLVSGTLNPALGGHSVKVPLEPEVYDLLFTEGEPDGLWPVTPDARQHTRRSIYLFNKRNVRIPLFEAFDLPDTLNSCAFRPVSTHAPQALILMNSPFVREQGKALAVAIARRQGMDPRRQIESLYREALGRDPRDDERKLAGAFLEMQTATIRDRLRARLPIGLDPGLCPPGADLARVRALADLCVVLFNTHEFVHIP